MFDEFVNEPDLMERAGDDIESIADPPGASLGEGSLHLGVDLSWKYTAPGSDGRS